MTTTELALRRGATADAERLAIDGFDWCTIATAHARAGDLDSGRRCVARALAIGRADDVTLARNVARIHHLELRDRDAAARVLAAFGAVLLAGEPNSRTWFLFAAAWDELGDRDAAHDYLVHARAVATSVADWCDVALGYQLVAEPALARELVARAETSAQTVAERLTIANTYLYSLDDPALAEASLERARAAATVGDVVQLVEAYEQLFPTPDYDLASRQLEEAEARATTVDDWLALAHGWRTIALDDDAATRCLDRADALVRDAPTSARAASARSPDDTPPIARRPAALRHRRDTLHLPCDPTPLFDWLRSRMTPAQLQALAANDYGYGAEEGYPILWEMCASGELPVPLPGNLRENIELERWGHGDPLSCAFACTVMCLAGPGYVGGEHESMSQLIESCVVLGDEAVAGMLALFGALEDDVFIAFGIVLAAARRDPSDPRLGPAIARVIAIDRGRGERSWKGGFIFGASNFSQCYPLWRSLATSILDHPLPRLTRFAALVASGGPADGEPG